MIIYSYFNEDSGDDIFSSNEIDSISVDLNNINLYDTNYDEHGPETIIYPRPLAWHSKFGIRKALKK